MVNCDKKGVQSADSGSTTWNFSSINPLNRSFLREAPEVAFNGDDVCYPESSSWHDHH